MNEKMRAYMLRNWESYNLCDSKEDFIRLLNILEFHGETLDSLHDVAFNGLDEFCGIIGRWDSDRETVQTLFEFNCFYKSLSELFEVFIENSEYDLENPEDIDELKEYISMQLDECEITHDGVVRTIYC